MNSFSNKIAHAAAALLRIGLVCLACVGAAGAVAGASELRARYGELREQLRNNNFHRPLHVDSSQQGDTLRGDVYAVLDHPFAQVSEALRDAPDWCNILILPFNTKYCHADSRNGATGLQVRIGRKPDLPVRDAYRLDFAFHPVATAPGYFESRLEADSGPLGTRDYRVVVAAVPLDAARTFMHLSYSYTYGLGGRLGMQAYLATAGADKVGFTITGRDANGQPVYIGGFRGVIERNAMRYYLAIDAHLSSMRAPPEQRVEKTIETWFDATERYPRQLREMDRSTYLALKRGDFERKQAMIE